MGVSGNLWSCLKEVKPLLMYDGEQGIALGSRQGNHASSRVDLRYTELFHFPAMTLVSFYTCEGVSGDSLEFHQENKGSLPVLLGTRNSSACSAGESGLTSRRGGNLMVFLELFLEPGLYSRVTAEIPIQNMCLFSEVKTPV